MVFWQRLKPWLLNWWRWKSSGSRLDWEGESQVKLDENLQATLRALAEEQHRSEDEVVSDLIYSALAQRTVEWEVGLELLRRWENLSPREQQVAALICRGYTNRQIAVRLDLSPATVKVYVRQILGKLGFHSKRELRINMEGRIGSGG